LEIFHRNGTQSTLKLDSPLLRVGRSPDNDLILDDHEVSGHHLEIYATEAGFMVRDLGSANGTSIGGQPIAETLLRSGDEITLGGTVLRIS
ncbi:FHA domain-containing protein, partial [Acidobacteriota bacterium]